jgi:hypothetical protein
MRKMSYKKKVEKETKIREQKKGCERSEIL